MGAVVEGSAGEGRTLLSRLDFATSRFSFSCASFRAISASRPARLPPARVSLNCRSSSSITSTSVGSSIGCTFRDSPSDFARRSPPSARSSSLLPSNGCTLVVNDECRATHLEVARCTALIRATASTASDSADGPSSKVRCRKSRSCEQKMDMWRGLRRGEWDDASRRARRFPRAKQLDASTGRDAAGRVAWTDEGCEEGVERGGCRVCVRVRVSACVRVSV